MKILLAFLFSSLPVYASQMIHVQGIVSGFTSAEFTVSGKKVNYVFNRSKLLPQVDQYLLNQLNQQVSIQLPDTDFRIIYAK